MPKLNLKDEGMEPEPTPAESEEQISPPPTLHESMTAEGGGLSPALLILIAVIALGALTFALNYFGVIHLWGKKVPAVVQVVPEPAVTQPPPTTEQPPAAEEITPTPTPTPTPTTPAPKTVKPKAIPPSTGGEYTIQVSSWMTPSKANAQVQRLAASGFDAYVQDARVSGEKWYRVRVGHYATEKEASSAAAQLQPMLENGIWVAHVGK